MEKADPKRLSVVIITFNEAQNLPACLASVRNLTDDIIVLDSISTDETAAIAQNAGATVYYQAFKGYAAQKNDALAYAKYDWVLSLDADEALTPELFAEIHTAPLDSLQNVAFAFKRLPYYCGEWVRTCGWYPDYQTRLFRKSQAQWTGDYLHEKLSFSNKVDIQRLSGDCLHYTVRRFSDHLLQIDRFSELRAAEWATSGKKKAFLYILIKPPLKFIESYIFKRGFLDGKVGLIVSFMNAFFYFAAYSKLFFYEKGKKKT